MTSHPIEHIASDMSGNRRNDNMTDPAITLPLDAVERVVALANKFGAQYRKPADKDALALIEREIEQVREMVGRD